MAPYGGIDLGHIGSGDGLVITTWLPELMLAYH